MVDDTPPALLPYHGGSPKGGIEIEWVITGSPLPARCVRPGQPVTFVWPDDPHSRHNVAQVSKEVYESCNGISKTTPASPPITGSAGVGTYYFVCGIGDHCRGGQKIIITVSNEC